MQRLLLSRQPQPKETIMNTYKLLGKATPTSNLWTVKAPDGRILKWSLSEGYDTWAAARAIAHHTQHPVEILCELA